MSTSTTPLNRAAWIPADKKPFEVKDAPYPTPGPTEIVIKNHAVAINPIDWIMQDQGTGFAFRWIKFPFIFGSDVAGQVVQVGSEITRFRVGDRVMGQATSTDEKINKASHGAFQLYTVLLEQTTTPISESMSFEEAAVMPLGLTTAAAGLFENEQLGLRYPSMQAKPIKETVLIWGGSTSVGCNAIQLAVAAGYDVVSTASPRNFDLVKSLGAREVFDYRDMNVTNNIVKSLEGQQLAGAMAIGEDSAFRCIDVLSRCKGHRHLAMATLPIPSQPKRFAALQIVFHMITGMASIFARSRIHGIKTSVIWGSVAHSPVGNAVYRDYLPEALASGKFRAAPAPEGFGRGLDKIQDALKEQKKGVSAKKIVVSLP
ncbi:hypothetical protein E8E13_006028 [Curvularia kusanoi]|uniref:Enoyl reductase (ER) domain-containing protein n=1 Tax=Curvularia kusanoi TaxID=90978 RepID=A0A9P4W3H4_CURKU|nr:hypothetical protein E8E13_006028 [Curvularia kusanoi]